MCDYCQWEGDAATEIPTFFKTKNSDSRIEKSLIKIAKEASPIIIIHGFPSHIKDPNPSILELIKKSATEGYKMLVQDKEAIDVVESIMLLLDKGCEYSRGSLIKCAALADDRGRTGCVTGPNETVSVARKLLEKGLHPSIITQEQKINKKDNEISEEISDKISGCWGVIVRDKTLKISCGRISWEFNDNFPLSIPAATTIYGCGIFINEKTCFSLSGDDETIYTKIPARKMFRSMESTDKNLTSRRQIMKLMTEFKEKKIGVVFLGNFDRPVIFCKSKSFPWVYCSRNMMNYGSFVGEVHSEDVVLDEEPDCRCHWR